MKGVVVVIFFWGEIKVGDVVMIGGDNVIYLFGEYGEDVIKLWLILKIIFEKGMFVYES